MFLATVQNYVNGNLSAQEIEEGQNWIKEIATMIMTGKTKFLARLSEVPQLAKDGNIEGFRIGMASYFKSCLINSEKWGKSHAEKTAFARALDDLTYAYYAPDMFNKLSLHLYKASTRFKKNE